MSKLRSQILNGILCVFILALCLVGREQSNTIKYQRVVLRKQDQAVRAAHNRVVACEAVLRRYNVPEPPKQQGATVLTAWR